MKERRSKRYKATDTKKNEKSTTDDQDDWDYENPSNESDSNESGNKEKTQQKTPKRTPRRSGRTVNKKSFYELSDQENDEIVEGSENNSPKKESRKKPTGSARLRSSIAEGDEMNGEKVQTKRDLRMSAKTGENETKCDKNDENEDKVEEEQVDENSGKLVKSAKKALKRKISSKASEAKKSKGNDSKGGESKATPGETNSLVKSKKYKTKKCKSKSADAKVKDKNKDDGEDDDNKNDDDDNDGNDDNDEIDNDDDDDDDKAEPEEYEVEKLIDIYFKKNGTREFLVRWKGYSSKDDTWEPEKHLNCKELIDAFLEKCEKAKSFPMREMRRDRRATDRYIVNESIRGRKLSARLKHKPRKTYFDVE